ncbi:S-layer homology domain-containing protein [Paenibacillus rigui]|nr:S-layer homology domain-containing protein [Paenibacillus rigui]
MRGFFDYAGRLFASALFALLVCGLLPAYTSYAATTTPFTTTADYFVDNSGHYASGDPSYNNANWIGNYFDPAYGSAQTVLKFDLTSITGPVNVSSAQLKIRVTDLGTNTVAPFLNVNGSNDDSWTESSATVPSKDVSIASNITSGIVSGQDLTVDVTGFVSSQVSGDKIVTLVLSGSTSGGTTSQFAIASKETSGGVNAPTLSVTYSSNPVIASVVVPANGVYKTGQNLDFTVNFDQNITADTTGGTPYLPITIGSSTVNASYVSGSGSSALVFRYTVQGGESDSNGISVGSSINANGGTLKNTGGSDAILTLNSVGSTSLVLVDAVAPTVNSVSVPANGAYKAGATLDFTVNLSENATVNTAGGTPYLPLTIGSAAVQASYVSGSGTGALLFRYTVQSGQDDTDGIAVSSALSLNGGTIQDAAGNDAVLALNGVGNTSAVLVDTTSPTVTSVGVPVNGTYKLGDQLNFTVNFSENVTVNTAGGTPYLPVTIGSAPRQASYVSGSGTNALVFGYTVQNGESDANGIALGSGLSLNGGTGKDAAGNDAVLTLSNVGDTSAILVDAIAPTVSSVGVPANGVYATGTSLDFTVSFSENVLVNKAGGTPYLPVTIGATPVQAAYVSGSGTSTLAFQYTVLSGQSDTDGIGVGSTLLANGGTLLDSAGNSASLTLNAVGSTGAVLVDAASPTVSSVGVPANGVYKAGANLDVTVNFSENVTVDGTGGTPYISLTIGSSPVQASYVSGSGTNALVFRYAIQAGDNDADGIQLASSMTLNGGTLKDAVGNPAVLALNAIGGTSGVLVDTTAPAVSSVSVPANGTYKMGDQLNFTVNYSENVTVDASGGNPYLMLTIGSTSVQAAYMSGSGTNALLFQYTVLSGHEDNDGVAVGALSLNGAALRDAAGNDADMTLNNVGGTGSVLVDAIVPTVTNVTVPADGTYVAGANLDLTVNFSEPVSVNTAGGTPYLPLTIGSTTVNVSYVSGSGTNTLVFRYTVLSGQSDADGITVGSAIASNGSTLRDSTGNDATLTLNGVGSTGGVLVDAVAPTVSSVSVPANGAYKAGAHLDFAVNYNENVAVNTAGGTPYLVVTIGSTPVQASYVSGSSTNVLVFRYTIQSGDNDADGIQTASSVTLNGGTIKDAAGNDTILTLNNVGGTSDVLVDTIAPVVSSVSVPVNGTYHAGANLDFTVTYSEPVVLDISGGTPSIQLQIGSSVADAVYVESVTPSQLRFRYTVRIQDQDTDGISAAAASVSLNGAAITDAAGNTADGAFHNMGALQQVLVSNNLSITLSHNGWINQNVTAEVVSDPGNQIQYRLGSDGVWSSYSGPVVVAQEGLTVFYARVIDPTNHVSDALSADIQIDKTAPTIGLNGDSVVTLYQGDTYVEQGAQVQDAHPAAAQATVTGSVYVNQIGTYELRYHAVDLAGNAAQEVVRTVHVISKPIGLRFNELYYTAAEGSELPYQVIMKYSDQQEIDVTNQAVFHADNNQIADVSTRGIIKALASGQTVLRAVYGGQTAQSTLTVTPIAVALSFGESAYQIRVGQEQQTQVIAQYSNGSQVDVTTKANYSLTGTGATVSADGKVAGTSVGTSVVEATYGGLRAQSQIIVFEGSGRSRSGGSGSSPNVRQVKVEAGGTDPFQVVAQIEIVREEADGKKIDAIVMSDEKTEQAINASQANQETLRIFIDELLADPADVVKVTLPASVIARLSGKAFNLEIRTEHAKVYLSNDVLKSITDGKEYYFNFIPVRKQEEQQAVKQRTVTADVIRQVVKSGEARVIGMPMTIETNLPKVPVQVTFPVDPSTIPGDAAQRKLFLPTLGVYIEHSDGEKVLERGEIVTDTQGSPAGIRIQVNKFSTFTIVSTGIGAAPVHHEPYIQGYPDGTFRPAQSLTRAEMSALLSRIVTGSSQSNAGAATTSFTDVDSGYWAADAIRSGVRAGLLSGYPNQSFKPDATITRAEMAAIIIKWMKLEPSKDKKLFHDMQNHWAADQAAAVAGKGLMTGYADGSFRPDQALTRAEAVVIINRILQRGPLTGVNDPTWSDVQPSFWAFPDIEEASRTHNATRQSEASEAEVWIP